MDLPDHHVYPPLGGRSIDVETEMREQDASARHAQRNLLIAIVVVGTLAVIAYIGDLPAGTVLFGVTVVILAVAFGILALARRSIRRNFGSDHP